jgi:hypothetical protein
MSLKLELAAKTPGNLGKTCCKKNGGKLEADI